MSQQDQLDMEFGYDLIDNGTSDDYYTPPWLFKALKIEFDLDVCAPAGGVPWIPAKRSLSIIDDGLNTEWYGRVWMNPPYSKSTPWVNKFMEHQEGICLMPFAKSAWCNRLWDNCHGIVMLPSNFRFAQGSIFIETMLAAYGPHNVEALHCSNIGRVR